MTSSTRRWNGSTGTTTDGCTASSATSHLPSSKPPTTLNQRHSNRSRHKYEVGNEPGTVHIEPTLPPWFSITEIAVLKIHPAMRLRIDNALRTLSSHQGTRANGTD